MDSLTHAQTAAATMSSGPDSWNAAAVHLKKDAMKGNPESRMSFDELEMRMQAELRGRIHDLQLAHREDGIILRGIAHTYYAKQLAQQALKNLTKVPILANEIEVR